jgi:DeoR family transcriptional regulator, suf operon transcriptional repressor
MDRKSEVLAFLKAREQASLGEVAAELGVTKQGALRHLEALRVSGLVTVDSSSHAGPGRPEHCYRLTAGAGDWFPRGHRELAAELIAFMKPRQLEQFFKDRAARLEKEYAARLDGGSLAGRVQALAEVASEHGYMTQVGEVPGGLQMRHCNCPIQDIAARTSHPCQQEQEMYERLLQAPVERTAWLGQGDRFCTYDISTGQKTTSTRGKVNG